MNKKQIGMISTIISAILFGTMPVATKIAFENGANSYMVCLGRFFWGSIFLWIFIQFSKDKRIQLNKKKVLSVLKLSIFYAITPMLLYLSYESIDSGMATTLHFTYPIVVMLILFLWYKDKIDKKQVLCLAMCIIGILMLYASDGKVDMVGMTLALVSGVVYAMYIVQLKKTDLGDMPLLQMSFLISVFATIEIFIFTLISGNFSMEMNVPIAGAQVYLGVFATALAVYLFQKGTMICGAVHSSLLSTFEPVTGIVLGVLIYGEILTGKIIFGIVAILLAAIILVIPIKRK